MGESNGIRNTESIADMNSSNFQAIIENYEIFIKELTGDLAFLKSEHINLQATVKTLLEENQRLSIELNAVLECKERIESCAVQEKEVVENLKKQISALISEKESTTKLWKNSVRTIDFLEDELKVFQAGTQGFIPKKDFAKVKQHYEERNKLLESKLNVIQKKLEDTIKTSSKELSAKNEEVDKSSQAQADALKIVKNLEEEILNLQKRLHDSEKLRMKLEKNVKDKEDLIGRFKRENSECRGKVQEAVELVAAALNEKDAALMRENEIKSDMEQINKEMEIIIKETEDKIKHEVAKTKFEYNLKCEQFLKDLKAAHDEISTKQLEIEKYTTKCMLLEKEIEKIQKGTLNIDESRTSKLLILEKNLEQTFQKLLISERDGIKNDLEQMAGHFERTLKSKEVEKLTFQNKVKQLQMNLEESKAKLVRLTEELEEENNRTKMLEKQYQSQKQEQEKSIRQSYEEKIALINSTHGAKFKEMESSIIALSEINMKWISETKFITENFDKLVAELKAEIQNLKGENKILQEKLKDCGDKIVQYKIFVELVTKDVNRISDMAKADGDFGEVT
ncbi:hypothetical protein NQ317_012495 [Molorchus minor]|uniref:Uncharacterized protein n=1 Tax=Molorchus minor TaxID=1323400 RepID=A0ABQ9K2W7_9CUCU|nr:hypothetical protein NQ317_012495 [Molorchus minor]